MTALTYKVHAPDPKNPQWPLCRFISEALVDDDPANVTCGHCKTKLGLLPPREALILAVLRWYDTTMTMASNTALRRAVEDYHKARRANRYRR